MGYLKPYENRSRGTLFGTFFIYDYQNGIVGRNSIRDLESRIIYCSFSLAHDSQCTVHAACAILMRKQLLKNSILAWSSPCSGIFCQIEITQATVWTTVATLSTSDLT